MSFFVPLPSSHPLYLYINVYAYMCIYLSIFPLYFIPNFLVILFMNLPTFILMSKSKCINHLDVYITFYIDVGCIKLFPRMVQRILLLPSLLEKTIFLFRVLVRIRVCQQKVTAQASIVNRKLCLKTSQLTQTSTLPSTVANVVLRFRLLRFCDIPSVVYVCVRQGGPVTKM